MNVSELISKLEALQAAHGDVRVVCAPYSYKPEAYEARKKQKRCWWCKQRMGMTTRLLNVGETVITHPYNANEMVREPEPAAWGMPGMGGVGEGNPAMEVTL